VFAICIKIKQLVRLILQHVVDRERELSFLFGLFFVKDFRLFFFLLSSSFIVVVVYGWRQWAYVVVEIFVVS
jgi:hypothetical protein